MAKDPLLTSADLFLNYSIATGDQCKIQKCFNEAVGKWDVGATDRLRPG